MGSIARFRFEVDGDVALFMKRGIEADDALEEAARKAEEAFRTSLEHGPASPLGLTVRRIEE